eukprot:3298130-Rhodomonas_salina.1
MKCFDVDSACVCGRVCVCRGHRQGGGEGVRVADEGDLEDDAQEDSRQLPRPPAHDRGTHAHDPPCSRCVCVSVSLSLCLSVSLSVSISLCVAVAAAVAARRSSPTPASSSS